MAKVLFIGHYRESSGWGVATRNMILALDSVGVDVVCRPLILSQSNFQPPQRILELEQKSSIGCDICIQYVLPHFFVYDGSFRKNIGVFVLETLNIKSTHWPAYIKLMDEIWVPCEENRAEVHKYNTNVKVVPHTFDLKVYNKQYEKLSIPEIRDNFTFYFIGEAIKRKNIAALVKAFHVEFANYEPVSLLIKTNRSGMNDQVLAHHLLDSFKDIRSKLKLYKNDNDYKKELLITSYLENDALYGLHQSCNCFVMPSYGEGFCIPAWEAMAFGNTVVANEVGGVVDYINHTQNGYLVNSKIAPVFDYDDTFEDFGTAREKWHEVSISNLMQMMRMAYELPAGFREKMYKMGKEKAEEYSFEKIGNLMQCYLQ